MQDHTPEMERINAQLRDLMREWVQHPERNELKERYNALHRQYQRLLTQQKRQSLNGVA